MTIEPTPGTPYESILEPEVPDLASPTHASSDATSDEFVQMLKETADKLVRDGATRGDVKLLATALRELRYCFKVFNEYRGRRKVTIFGSARTKPDTPLTKPPSSSANG